MIEKLTNPNSTKAKVDEQLKSKQKRKPRRKKRKRKQDEEDDDALANLLKESEPAAIDDDDVDDDTCVPHYGLGRDEKKARAAILGHKVSFFS